jgi:2-polyprenyl-3-methyl-5-hydroxy-6-metoxy-1,4-benzoquinol methylase
MNYSSKPYWDNRFSTSAPLFDWYCTYLQLKSFLSYVSFNPRSNLTKYDQILNIGSGNSLLSEQMSKDGYLNIHNLDISDVAVAKMNDRKASFL